MLDIRPLNSELQAIAEEKLNEEPDKSEEILIEFRTWIESLTHLRARRDDQFLIAFLRVCRFDLEKAKAQLELFYKLRNEMPDLIKDRNPTNMKLKAIIRLGIGVPLPQTEPGGSRYYLIRPGAFDPTYFKIQDVIKVCTMVNDILIRDDDNWTIAGQVGILDLAKVTKLHLKQLNPGIIKKWTLLSQDLFPVNLMGFHYINAPPGFEEIFKTFLSCMSEENQTRVYVHGCDLESFHRIVPRYLMPKEYGGSLYSLREVIKEWEDKIFSFRQYFEEEDEQFGIIEETSETDAKLKTEIE